MPLFLDWRTVSDPAEVVRPVVEAFEQGSLVVLPSETGYLIAASAARPDAVTRLLLTSPETADTAAVVVSGASEAEAILQSLSRSSRRLLERLWPGPVGIAAADKDGLNQVRLRSPGHTAMLKLVESVNAPFVVIEVGQHEQTAAVVAERLGDAATVVVDAGPLPFKPTTWVAFDGSGFKIVSPGVVSEAEILAAAAVWIVFVCTGNTCRSPMAETLCKIRLAAMLGCNVDDLSQLGFVVSSAGVSAYAGDGPTPEAVDVLRELGADLSDHRSQLLAVASAAKADHLIAMTRSHLLAVLTRYPLVGGSMRLLCGLEGDLDDPIGGGREVYESCARTIVRHLDRLIEELVR